MKEKSWVIKYIIQGISQLTAWEQYIIAWETLKQLMKGGIVISFHLSYLLLIFVAFKNITFL